MKDLIKPGPRYEALLELLHSTDVLWNASRVFLARWELSPSQFNILFALAENKKGISQAELSEKLIMHRSNATGLIDRLEARNMVGRKEDPKDRRAWKVVLKPEGEKLLKEILPTYFRLSEEIWGKCAASEATRMARNLGEISARAMQLALESTYEEKR